MAFVVTRPGGRFEIRETRSVGGRTRSRTLATFTTLDDDVLAHARRRAELPFDAEAVRSGAVAKGAPLGPRKVDAIVGELLVEIDGRATIRPGLRRLLQKKLAGEPPDPADHHLERMVRWMHATAEERSATTIDLLSVNDAIGPQRVPRRYWWTRSGGVERR